jgi:hypothetical protein
VSRWATAWQTMKPADTVDSVDTVDPRTASPSLARGSAPHIVNRVNSVTGKARGRETDTAGQGVHTVNSVTPLPDHQCDATHIRAVPALPQPGRPQRDRLDRRQAEMVAGLLAGFRNHRNGEAK